MPELSQLAKSGLDWSLINPSLHINPAMVPDPLPPDTRGASAALGKAAIYGAVADTIAKLPSTFTQAYKTGTDLGMQSRENESKKLGLQVKDQVLSGAPLSEAQRGALSGVTFGPSGETTMRVPGLYDLDLQKIRLDEAKAEVDYKKAMAEKARAYATTGTANPLADAFGSVEPELPTKDILGTATSYGYNGDQFGGPSATSSKIGPAGNTLDEYSMALSPDQERAAAAKGLKLGDWVTVHTDKGDILRRWDDRTAQDDPTGQWAVDDQGNKIPDGKGGFLPALRGRWDFRATADGKPNPLEGSKILGFTKITDENGGTMPKFDKDGLALLPDIETKPDIATSATGGIDVMGQGHFGGKVTKFPGFFREETPDAFYIYKQHLKPGERPFIQVKKPGGVDTEQVKNIADAIEKGEQPPSLGSMYKMAAPVRAELAKRGYDLANAQMDWDATKRHLSTLNGPQQTRIV